MKTSFGDMDISVSMDRNGDFDPQFIKSSKQHSRVALKKRCCLCTPRAVTSDIESHIREIYGIFDRDFECHYRINRYNHRYNNNPFRINEIYEDNVHRPFINGRKGELEMLIMYVWLFEDVKDTDYWPEYVNLCVTTGRVNLVDNINIFLPSKIKDIAYPADIPSTIMFLETTNGSINSKPDSKSKQ